jgi:GNAT superfamily N-acetyltransferase
MGNLETVLIPDAQAAETHKILLESFKELYDDGFPDEDEREDFALILDRVRDVNEVPRSAVFIYRAAGGERALGGFVADWYGGIGALHLTYLIVDPRARKQGIAKKLINDGVPAVIRHLNENENVTIKINFFESNNPFETAPEKENFDPQTRLRIVSELGAKLIPISYIQPSLGEGKGEVSNLLLFTFSQFNAHETELPACDVIDFLKEFYRVSGYRED